MKDLESIRVAGRLCLPSRKTHLRRLPSLSSALGSSSSSVSTTAPPLSQGVPQGSVLGPPLLVPLISSCGRTLVRDRGTPSAALGRAGGRLRGRICAIHFAQRPWHLPPSPPSHSVRLVICKLAAAALPSLPLSKVSGVRKMSRGGGGSSASLSQHEIF